MGFSEQEMAVLSEYCCDAECSNAEERDRERLWRAMHTRRLVSQLYHKDNEFSCREIMRVAGNMFAR